VINKNIKKVVSNNETYAHEYAKSGFIPFTLNIGLKEDGRKDIKPPKGYNDIDSDTYIDYVFNKHNGMALRTGILIDDEYYLILIDIDNKESETVKNGMDKWKQIIKGKIINTPTQKTGNDGLHYLFKVSENIFDKLKSSGTELVIDGEKYAIDYKAKNQFMIVEPSKYDGKYYKWTTNISTPVQEMPDWLVRIIINVETKMVKKQVIKEIKDKVTRESTDDDTINTSESVSSNDVIQIKR
jgi:hypothetical protein